MLRLVGVVEGAFERLLDAVGEKPLPAVLVARVLREDSNPFEASKLGLTFPQGPSTVGSVHVASRVSSLACKKSQILCQRFCLATSEHVTFSKFIPNQRFCIRFHANSRRDVPTCLATAAKTHFAIPTSSKSLNGQRVSLLNSFSEKRAIAARLRT